MLAGSSAPALPALDAAAEAVRNHLLFLREEVEHAEEHARELWASVAPPNDVKPVVELSVGGDTCFVFARDHFSFLPGSLLEALISERWDTLSFRDSAGRIFLDVDPDQFRAILDWVFEAARCTSRYALPPSPAEWLPEPHRWGLDLLIGLLGLEGREELVADVSELRIDVYDGQPCTFKELAGKYGGQFSDDEMRDLWQHMQPARQVCIPGAVPSVKAPAAPDAATAADAAQKACGVDGQLAALLEGHVRAVLTEGRRLQERLQRAKDEERRFHAEKEGLERLFGRSDPNDIVHFNAGGRVMATTKATLTHFDGSMLARWFGGGWTLQEGDLLKGAVRIENDSETFAAILQVLRFRRIFGAVRLPGGYPCRKARLPVLRQALSYFQLELGKGTGKGKGGAGQRMAPEGNHSQSSESGQPGRSVRPEWAVAVAVAL